MMRLRRRLFEILEVGDIGDRTSQMIDLALVTLIIANVIAVAAESVEDLHQRFYTEFLVFEIVSVVIFGLEYLARVWVCVEGPKYGQGPAWRGRLRYVLSLYALIDLAAVLPSVLWMLLWPDLRFLRIFRLVRLLKLARYSPALHTLGRVLAQERRALAASLVIMTGLLFFSASVIYFVEREAQPEAFGSIPAALWWALATLTTVGYGDIVPVTAAGRMFGGIVMVFGLAVFALPIGILASGFASEIQRREFVVTWGMVARVPLFAGLDAAAIAEIAGLLRTRVVNAGGVITRRGDPADGMYFILSGEVEIYLPGQIVRLGEGEFFGELSLLRRTRRQANIIAVRKCHLLMLEAADFHRLIKAHPDIEESVMRIARERSGASLEAAGEGDLSAAEIEAGRCCPMPGQD